MEVATIEESSAGSRRSRATNMRRNVGLGVLESRLVLRGLAQHHAANNTDAEDVQPAVHEVEQMGVR